MSYNKQRKQYQRRVTLGVGLFLTFIMGASLILPALSTAVPAQDAASLVPTSTPAPTVPAPIEDLSGIQFNETFLHPTGLFEAAVPTGWRVQQSTNNVSEARTTLRNDDQLSVVEFRVIEPAADLTIDSVNDLSQLFNESWLRSSWSGYSSWNESAREVREDELVIDFTLSQLGQDYIARQVASTDGDWVYVSRVVAPNNAAQQLRHILDGVSESLTPNKQFLGTPFNWNGYYDVVDGHFLRYPATWQLVDSADGAPTSIAGNDLALRVEAMGDVTIDSEDAASEFVTNLQPGASVISTQTIERDNANGYSVTYTRPTLDGPEESGFAVLLNDSGTLHVANLTLQASGVDLNSTENETYAPILQALETFSVLPDLAIASAS